MQQSLAEPVQGKKIQPLQHNSQILVMSVLDPISKPKCQIKKRYLWRFSTENTFLLDDSTTRTVASGRELELPASLVISSVIRVRELACHHFYHWTDVS